MKNLIFIIFFSALNLGAVFGQQKYAAAQENDWTIFRNTKYPGMLYANSEKYRAKIYLIINDNIEPKPEKELDFTVTIMGSLFLMKFYPANTGFKKNKYSFTDRPTTGQINALVKDKDNKPYYKKAFGGTFSSSKKGISLGDEFQDKLFNLCCKEDSVTISFKLPIKDLKTISQFITFDINTSNFKEKYKQIYQ